MTVKRLPPSISPKSVLDQMASLPLDGRLEADGFIFTLDAPAMCDDRAFFFPVATIEGDDEVSWYPTGEVGDPITDATEWVEI